MKKKIYLLMWIALLSGTLSAQQTQVPVLNFTQFEPLLHHENDTVYVLNFWATWCAPCVKELPYFEQLQAEYSGKKLKVILVSMDSKSKLEKSLLPFLQKRGIKSQVVLLSEPDANAWINKIAPQWSGAIPATLIYTKGYRQFYEQEFTYEALQQEVRKSFSDK